AGRMDAGGGGYSGAPLVVDRGGRGAGIRSSVGRASFRGAQHARDLRSSAVFLVGRPAHGLLNDHRPDGERSEKVYRPPAWYQLNQLHRQVKNRGTDLGSSPLP